MCTSAREDILQDKITRYPSVQQQDEIYVHGCANALRISAKQLPSDPPEPEKVNSLCKEPILGWIQVNLFCLISVPNMCRRFSSVAMETVKWMSAPGSV